MVFDSLKYHYLSYIITRYRQFVLWFLSKKFINVCRIAIVSVISKKAEMAPFGGILHISYPLKEEGPVTPTPFLLFGFHEIQPCNNCPRILIPRTIIDELP